MTAKIIVFGATKGGVGKTTLAIQFALACACQGKKVWLVDADRQTTAMKAMGLRAAAGLTPLVACTAFTNAKELRTKVLENKERWDIIVIDVCGNDTDNLRMALSVCDKLICPLAPTNYEVWAALDVLDVVNECNAYRNIPLTAINVVLNCAVSQTSARNKNAIEVLKPIEGIHMLKTVIVNRLPIADASGVGMRVCEYSKEKKAISEIDSFVEEVLNDE